MSRIAAFLLAGACVHAGLGSQPVAPASSSRFEFTEPHMGTTFRVVLYAADESEASAATHRAFARIAELDRTLSDYEATSELSRATRTPVGESVVVGEDLLSVLMAPHELAPEYDTTLA